MPEELNPDLVRCPVCLLKYGWQNCRWSTYTKEGVRREECLTCCGVREKEEAKQTPES